MKIGVVKETKNPPDKRVPISPNQCAEIKAQYPDLELVVQPSPIRKFEDNAYETLGITMQEDLSDCEVLIGVKEVNIETLIPNKTYFFFSHTYKLQPYNAPLLAAILDRKIRLVDYEMIKAPSGKRLIGFGRYAGVVGCYNGFRTFGLKHQLYDLKPAHQCEDRADMEAEMKKIALPKKMKVVLTGFGRVGHGAREIISQLPIREVGADEFLSHDFDQAVFTHLNTHQYNERISDGGFDKSEFYQKPELYRSTFPPFCGVADVYIACHYWGEGAPFLFNRDDIKESTWKTSVVADTSCDIDGPVASTLRPSTIADPIYGYDKQGEVEIDFMSPEAIAVMAVDNLPCELPKDASEDFGNEFINQVLPHLLDGDTEGIIAGASETDLNGKLTSQFSYLQEYVNQAK